MRLQGSSPSAVPALSYLGSPDGYVVGGLPGRAATVAVGSTTTGSAGSSASVVNSGSTSAAVLNFTVPQGPQGPTGADGSATLSGLDAFALSRKVCTTLAGGSGVEDGAHTWAKLATVVTSGSRDINLSLGVVGSYLAQDAAVVNVAIRTGGVGVAPAILNCEMISKTGTGGRLGADSFKFISGVADAGGFTTAEVWMKKTGSLGQFAVYELSRFAYAPTLALVTYHANAPWQSAVPSGAANASSNGVTAFGVPVVTTTGVQALTNKTLTTPTITDPRVETIRDNAGVTYAALANSRVYISPLNRSSLEVLGTASAVNSVGITGAVTNGSPQVYATGETNVNLNLVSRGTGTVNANNIPVVTTTGAQSVTNKTFDATNTFPATVAGQGLTSTATAAGTTTLTSASTPVQVFTGTTTQTVLLPTTGVVAGQQFTIVNNSTGAVTVQSSGANTVVVLPGSSTAAANFTALVATPTTAANWLVQRVARVTTQTALTTGTSNTALGHSAQPALTTGNFNTGIGFTSQTNMTSGTSNTAVGFQSQSAVTNGGSNTSVGSGASQSLTTGGLNTSVGTSAQSALTTGGSNTAVGQGAQASPLGSGTNATTTASFQTAIGRESGQNTATQVDGITTIGYRATAATANSTAVGRESRADHVSSVALGYLTTTTADNQVAIGGRSLAATGTDQSLNLTSTGTGTVQANGVPVVTTTGVQTLTGKTLTGPTLNGPTFSSLKDPVHGLNLFVPVGAASAVNYLNVLNGATNSPPGLQAAGADTNVGLDLKSKGTGSVTVNGNHAVNKTAAVPATATSTGIVGQVAYNATHFYVCTATNTWVRAALATW